MASSGASEWIKPSIIIVRIKQSIIHTHTLVWTESIMLTGLRRLAYAVK
jgi:hypothetical protein